METARIVAILPLRKTMQRGPIAVLPLVLMRNKSHVRLLAGIVELP
jgi:hypothetical protein